MVGTLAARTIFLTIWAPQEGALFSPPSIAVLWIAVAAGAGLILRGGRAGHRLLLDLWLLLLAVLLLVNNGGYLRSI